MSIWIPLISIALACTPIAGGQERIESAQGSIYRVSEEWFGIVPDDDPGTRYAPDHLPEEFRVHDLRVIFSGVVGEIPPNTRRWGRPLHLTEIRRLSGHAE